MTDTEAVENAGQAARPACRDRGDEVLRRFLPHPLQGHEVTDGEPVEIGVIADELGGDELVDELVPEPLDIHRAARGKESEPLPDSGRTGNERAAEKDSVGILDDAGATFRALGRRRPRDLVPGALVLLHADDMGDHLARLLDDDDVAGADVLAGDLVGVVEARAADDRAGQLHRLQIGHRRHRPPAPHLDADPGERCRGLELLKLPRDCPARSFGGCSRLALLGEVVDLDDEAVDLEVEGVELFDEHVAMLDQSADRRESSPPWCDGEPRGPRPGLELRLRADPQAGGVADPVAEEAQGARCALARVKEPDAAGGDVARVGVWRLAIPGLRLVQTNEVGIGHVDLAADLDPRRRVGAVETQRQVADRPGIVGDVVADSAVAARRCQRQATGVIGQRHRHAVDLQFEHPGDRPRVTGRGEEGLDLPRPGDEIVGGVGVVDRQHRDRVPHRGEAVEGLPADALRRAVGGDELWVARLENAELVDEPVVVEIADLGCRLKVVAPVVVADQVAERRDPLRAAETHGRASPADSASPAAGGAPAGGRGCSSRSSRSRRRIWSWPSSS